MDLGQAMIPCQMTDYPKSLSSPGTPSWQSRCFTSQPSPPPSLVEFLPSVRIEPHTLGFKYVFNPFPVPITDSTMVISVFNNIFELVASNLRNKWFNTRTLLIGMNCIVSHVHREGNKVADLLACSGNCRTKRLPLHQKQLLNGLNTYLNPRVRGSIRTEGKNSIREGGGEGCEVKHRDRQDGAPGAVTCGAIRAVELAYHLNWKNLWLETDSTMVVSVFNNISEPVAWNLRNRWFNTRTLLIGMNCIVTHVYREGKKVADLLACHGLSLNSISHWNVAPSFIRNSLAK
ncbi:hypothetical protein TSUD_61180 [Trifolium subterraneum]|uniref:RNase H type-1 domain-containing protein n=1 Tax=Trifolium subterraneum TaxID=3900 RepID=A0A2Z6MTF1_TRISU|nr:hypothetical protein TSUD_61180 [Trifolium subterraneum]